MKQRLSDEIFMSVADVQAYIETLDVPPFIPPKTVQEAQALPRGFRFGFCLLEVGGKVKNVPVMVARPRCYAMDDIMMFNDPDGTPMLVMHTLFGTVKIPYDPE